MPGACDSVHQPSYSATGITGRESRRTDASGSSLRPSSAQISRNHFSANTENFGAGRSKSRIAAAHQPPRLPRSSAGQRLGHALNDITNVAPDRKPKDACLDDKISVPKMPLANGSNDRQAALPTVTSSTSQDRSPLERDPANVQHASEYAVEIFDLLFNAEGSFLVRPNYMEELHRDINARMRAILIDWLVEVHMKYRLRNETLFLAINLLDRYLAVEPVARQRLQLVGVVAMFVAAKFEEIMPPEVHDFVYITDNAYTKADILALECTMLTVLSFQLAVPTTFQFLECLQHVNSCEGKHRELAQYFTELALLEVRMIRYPPSHLAAAALLLSNELMGRRPVWPLQMAQHSRHTEVALRMCVEDLRGLWEAANTSQLQAVKKKYTLAQHFSVARMTFGTS